MMQDLLNRETRHHQQQMKMLLEASGCLLLIWKKSGWKEGRRRMTMYSTMKIAIMNSRIDICEGGRFTMC